MIKKIKSFVVYRNNMPRKYLKADTAVLSLPKKIVFLDKKNKKHLLPALTKAHHLATHYGHSAIDLITGKQKYVKLASRGNLTTVKRVRKVATKKVAEAHKATAEVKKAVIKANVAMDGVAKAKRKYTKKRVAAVQAVNVAAAVGAAPTRRRRTPAQYAAVAGTYKSPGHTKAKRMARVARAIAAGMEPTLAQMTYGAVRPIKTVIYPGQTVVAEKKKRGRKPLTAEQKAANKLARDLKKKSSRTSASTQTMTGDNMSESGLTDALLSTPGLSRASSVIGPFLMGDGRRALNDDDFIAPQPGMRGFIGPILPSDLLR